MSWLAFPYLFGSSVLTADAFVAAIALHRHWEREPGL